MAHHDARIRVRYAETDQMGIVYHANYIVWMEVGRVEYFRASGVAYATMEKEDGILLAVVEANCRYIAPARYDEEILVRTRVVESNRRMARFGYEILRSATLDRLAEGETRHIFLNREMRPARLPDKYLSLFAADPA
ncbi:MAG: acyl-CoA thioesterase [Acidobacteria bacterium]|nr:acyl-CoA thioesterase [Acidobacteriota bacterium]